MGSGFEQRICKRHHRGRDTIHNHYSTQDEATRCLQASAQTGDSAQTSHWRALPQVVVSTFTHTCCPHVTRALGECQREIARVERGLSSAGGVRHPRTRRLPFRQPRANSGLDPRMDPDHIRPVVAVMLNVIIRAYVTAWMKPGKLSAPMRPRATCWSSSFWVKAELEKAAGVWGSATTTSNIFSRKCALVALSCKCLSTTSPLSPRPSAAQCSRCSWGASRRTSRRLEDRVAPATHNRPRAAER